MLQPVGRALCMVAIACQVTMAWPQQLWAQTTQPTALPEVTVRGTTPLMSVPLPC